MADTTIKKRWAIKSALTFWNFQSTQHTCQSKYLSTYERVVYWLNNVFHHVHNILRFFDGWAKVPFIASEREHDY